MKCLGFVQGPCCPQSSDDQQFWKKYQAQTRLSSIDGVHVWIMKDVVTDQHFVMKRTVKYFAQHYDADVVAREMTALQALEHENIIAFHEHFDTQMAWTLVLEHAEGNNLQQRIRGKPSPP